MPIDYDRLIPPLTLRALRDWKQGPRYFHGDFVNAVLSNDLLKAFSYADDENAAAMRHIMKFCFNELPASSWGSQERVNAWFKQWAGKRDDTGRDDRDSDSGPRPSGAGAG